MIDKNKYKGKNTILIGGDVCGIQNYIYQIVSKYAAKSLKGRSFYVQLLTDTIVRYMLDKLSDAELVYNSGGSFFIIASKSNESTLKDTIIPTIENDLWQRHGISLYVAIASVDIDVEDIENDLSNKFKDLLEKQDNKKFSKYAYKIINCYDKFFEPKEKPFDNAIDSITGEYYIDKNDQETYKPFNNESEITIRKLTRRQIDLGEKLRNATYITVAKRLESNKGDFDFLGYAYYIGKVAVDNIIEIIKFNDESSARPFYYAGSSWNGETFDTLCQSKGEDDFKRLGVLRMDVDNMGEKFQGKSTFKEFQELSHSLDRFFGKTLDEIKNDKYKESIFIIYSGGDDVFAIGDWKDIMEFAKNVHDKFNEEFEGFTISAGVSLITLKFPVMKGAEYAGQEERLAKSNECYDANGNKFEKNSISLFKTPLNWDYEFNNIQQLVTEIERLCNEEKIKPLETQIMTHFESDEDREVLISNIKACCEKFKGNNSILCKQIEECCDTCTEEELQQHIAALCTPLTGFIERVLSYYEKASFAFDIKNHKPMENVHKIQDYSIYWRMVYELGKLKKEVKNIDAIKMIDNCIKECLDFKKTYKALNSINLKTKYHPLELWAFACRLAEIKLRT